MKTQMFWSIGWAKPQFLGKTLERGKLLLRIILGNIPSTDEIIPSTLTDKNTQTGTTTKYLDFCAH